MFWVRHTFADGGGVKQGAFKVLYRCKKRGDRSCLKDGASKGFSG